MTGPPAERAAPLEIVDLEVNLGGRPILRRVSARVESGEFVALVGPNGAGKTTLLRAALGFLPPDRGSARLFGDEPAALPLRERSRRAAWLPQQESPSSDFALEEFVSLGRYPHQGSYGGETAGDRAAVRAAIAEAGLGGFEGRRILGLSGGERQRARYARALAQGSPLLVLDEPTTHLDMGYQIEIMRQLSEFRRGAPGRAVVAAVHDLNLACRFADRIAWLSHGRLVELGAPGATATEERIFEVFGVEATVEHRGGQVVVLPPRLWAAGVRAGSGRRVHVVCGGGSGREILDALVERGHRVSAGALHLLDSDQEFCQLENVATAVGAPFTPLSEEVRAENAQLLDSADAIVVAPFAVGPGNLCNLEDLVSRSARLAPILLVGGRPGRDRDFTDGRAATAYDRLVEAGALEVDGVPALLPLVEAAERSRHGSVSAPIPT